MMIRSVTAVVAAFLVAACQGAGDAGSDAAAEPARVLSESEFAELQERGRVAMGVDQYTSTHRFDMLPNGGRIELQRDADDPEGVAVIRQHLRDIALLFAAGDFRIPGFVHAMTLPGTDVMAAKRDRIRYEFADLPRGAELRLITDDPEAVVAIHDFMEFQRMDHRSGGHGH